MPSHLIAEIESYFEDLDLADYILKTKGEQHEQIISGAQLIVWTLFFKDSSTLIPLKYKVKKAF